MRIIRTAEQAKTGQNIRSKANKGCDVCPCCGETKEDVGYMVKQIYDKGIMSLRSECWVGGFFKPRTMQQDRYLCKTCGAIWEGEPYECW